MLVALGLPLDTGDDTALAQLSTLVQKARDQEQQIAALKANQFDPASIPLDEHQKLTTELAALKSTSDKAEHERLMTAALSDARILPPNEAYWRAQPLAALQAFLRKPSRWPRSRARRPAAPRLRGGGDLDVKDSNAIAQAALKYQQEQAQAGVTVSTAAAVAHVTKGA